MREWHGPAAWRLRYIAGAYTRARRLEAMREAFHRELYASIITPVALYGHDAYRANSARPDNQALRIIEAKERFEREVQKEYKLANEWDELLSLVDQEDKQLIDLHFRKGKHISRQARLRILTKYKDLMQKKEQETEQARDAEAMQAFKAQREADRWRQADKAKGKPAAEPIRRDDLGAMTTSDPIPTVLPDPDEYRRRMEWREQLLALAEQ
ncbi:hypothetical protein [Bhargavaea beijingensis]|uniref:Uncharacterized protein n=1 Tax=Bhargavaea beijingensis TaxID=426756 RepID=A0ABX9ZC57_9BACL|nr:hypothetical protein [Bhargavaea beijingensis]RSK30961.1 hypothetical protein EJA12_09600 [Bhargavaea beijingensis]